MKKLSVLLFVALLQVAVTVAMAQEGFMNQANTEAPSADPTNRGMGQLAPDVKMSQVRSALEVCINQMDQEKRDKLNLKAAAYRSTRGVGTDIANAMLQGGITGIVNVVGSEIINLMQIRSKQKKQWLEMRQRECTFVDSLQSVKGQNDFYGRPSSYGPLDPSDMQFDGITMSSIHDGEEIFRMVCHIDTSRLSHLFLHSKFYLVIDSLVFYPYKSYLPNMSACQVTQQDLDNMNAEERDYWETISNFDFEEQQSPTVKVQLDIYSSWINELVQVYNNVKLGSFSIDIPISKKDLTNSVYIYDRQATIAAGKEPLNINGDCFVVPRSYMPVSYDNPSWGTGEYKIKAIFSQNCRYNPKGKRAQNWHRDYKQLKKLMSHGKRNNEYLNDVITTFRDNRFTILKATYQPALTKGASFIKIGQSSNSPAGGMGAGGASGAGAAGGGAGGTMGGKP